MMADPKSWSEILSEVASGPPTSKPTTSERHAIVPKMFEEHAKHIAAQTARIDRLEAALLYTLTNAARWGRLSDRDLECVKAILKPE